MKTPTPISKIEDEFYGIGLNYPRVDGGPSNKKGPIGARHTQKLPKMKARPCMKKVSNDTPGGIWEGLGGSSRTRQTIRRHPD